MLYKERKLLLCIILNTHSAHFLPHFDFILTEEMAAAASVFMRQSHYSTSQHYLIMTILFENAAVIKVILVKSFANGTNCNPAIFACIRAGHEGGWLLGREISHYHIQFNN